MPAAFSDTAVAVFKELFVFSLTEALDDPSFMDVFPDNGPGWWNSRESVAAELGLDFNELLNKHGSPYEIKRLKWVCGKGPQPR